MEMTSQNYREILAQNEMIGRYIGATPEIEWSVASGPDSIRYCPSHAREYFPTPATQKIECERYIKEQEEKKYAEPGELAPHMFENWPPYHQSTGETMDAIIKITIADVANFDLKCSSQTVIAALQNVAGYKTTQSEPVSAEKDFQPVMYKVLVNYVRHMLPKKGQLPQKDKTDK